MRRTIIVIAGMLAIAAPAAADGGRCAAENAAARQAAAYVKSDEHHFSFYVQAVVHYEHHFLPRQANAILRDRQEVAIYTAAIERVAATLPAVCSGPLGESAPRCADKLEHLADLQGHLGVVVNNLVRDEVQEGILEGRYAAAQQALHDATTQLAHDRQVLAAAAAAFRACKASK